MSDADQFRKQAEDARQMSARSLKPGDKALYERQQADIGT